MIGASGETSADTLKSAGAASSADSAQVRVLFDLTKRLRFGSSEKLRREAYFNVHSTPGEFSDAELKWLTEDLNASFGRSMGTVSSFIHGLKEDKHRPGFADPEAAAQRAAAFAARRESTYAKSPRTHSIINSVHPYSYRGKHEGSDSNRDIFTPGSHEAAAELLTAFFAQTDTENEPYFEVANECNVKTRELDTTFEEFCDLHVTVARRLRDEVPGVKVGGPTAAWPAFEVKDFAIWRKQMGTFIDRAGSDMDFLSLHLYTTHWDNKAVNRFGANIDAILDLMENQSLLSTGEVKPLLISECGTGFRDGEQIATEYTPRRDWFILRGANHVFMNLLRRDDRIAKMVPFIVSKATWFQEDYPYPWVLFHRKGNTWEPTHLSKWYEFWKDVQGYHIPTHCSFLDVQTHALLSQNNQTAFLLLDNLTDENQPILLDAALPAGTEISSVTTSRIYYDGEAPQLDVTDQAIADWHRLTLRPQEACVIKLQLASPLEIASTLTESTYYGDKTLIPITGKPAFFRVPGPDDAARIESATLRIGFGRKNDLTKAAKVVLNGTSLEVPQDERGQCKLNGTDYFTTKEVSVPAELLKESNRVAVEFPEAGGHVASVVLMVRTLSPSEGPTNTAESETRRSVSIR